MRGLVGIDIDPQRIAEANANARAAGVTHWSSPARRPVRDRSEGSDGRGLYLLPSLNVKLRPKHAKGAAQGRPYRLDDFDMATGSRSRRLT